MDENLREKKVIKDILLTTPKGGNAGVNQDNISCFFRTKDDDGITRISFKYSTGFNSIDVIETPEQIMEIIDIPVVALDCHETEETECRRAFIEASNIAGYASSNHDPETCVVSLQQDHGSGRHFIATQDAKTICDKIYEAKKSAPRHG